MEEIFGITLIVWGIWLVKDTSKDNDQGEVFDELYNTKSVLSGGLLIILGVLMLIFDIY